MQRGGIVIGRFRTALSAALLAVVLAALAHAMPVGSQAPGATAAPAQPSAQPAAAPLAAGYAGSDTCVMCHTQGETLKGTAHGQASNPRSPAAGLGCESCHGPGQAHVDDDAKGHIKKFAQLKADESSQTCLTCHNRGEHAGWEGGAHAARNVSCTTCHSVHSYKSFAHQLKKETEVATCATCHKAQVIKTERAVTHMPVREGKMSCSSCHNPHGSISNVKALRTGNSVAESCISCHAEMRGPVLWEHAPVRENCATCHDPHGSSNDRMLTVRMPMLCQRCHVATRHPATIYDNLAVTRTRATGCSADRASTVIRTCTARTIPRASSSCAEGAEATCTAQPGSYSLHWAS